MNSERVDLEQVFRALADDELTQRVASGTLAELARIDELRVGGETQSIVVSPKGGMPAYEVIPETANRDLVRGERGSGRDGHREGKRRGARSPSSA